MKRPGSRASLLFRLIVPATAVFIVTILSMIAALFGDPKAPVAQWLDANAGRLLLFEFIVVIVLSLLAMTFDRLRTLSEQSAAKVPDDESQQPEATEDPR
jgi:Na+(H+)/acetate symporter ActP